MGAEVGGPSPGNAKAAIGAAEEGEDLAIAMDAARLRRTAALDPYSAEGEGESSPHFVPGFVASRFKAVVYLAFAIAGRAGIGALPALPGEVLCSNLCGSTAAAAWALPMVSWGMAPRTAAGGWNATGVSEAYWPSPRSTVVRCIIPTAVCGADVALSVAGDLSPGGSYGAGFRYNG